MSYKVLDHATDAFIEVTASSLTEAFKVAGDSVVDTILDNSKIEEKEERNIVVMGKDLNYLLYNWLEDLIYLIITEGFAIKKLDITLEKNEEYTISAQIFGEDIDIKKHGFKVEIKSPTFHEMEIKQEKLVTMRFLLDL
ncbi:MAG: archease [SAR202 cluster bacterium]|nr:archease [SAR202 cluster bacterium]MCH2604400.1 archease [Candidatus Nitrosopelagicus sp.]|tara:strand:- start:223 stop:639 length:417 start_codon:yes stop_codon:yes gene_type:complete